MPMLSLTSVIDILAIASSLAAFLAIRDYQRRRGFPYPPGPRPLPLIGNLLDIPKLFSWLSYTQLSKKHGAIYFPVKGLLSPDRTDDRGCLIFPCLWQSHRRIKFTQGKQRYPRKAWRIILWSSYDPDLRDVCVLDLSIHGWHLIKL
jgi:hypothetical protein